MKAHQKGQLENQLTVFFLIIFILIKVSPCYYACQLSTNSSSIFFRKANPAYKPANRRHEVVMVADKSLIEKTDSEIIPRIRFSGTPLVILFSGLFFASLAIFDKKQYADSGFPHIDGMMAPCRVLRL